MPRNLDKEVTATLRQRVREANATVTELATEFGVDSKTVRWWVKKEGVILPKGRLGRKMGGKNGPHPSEVALEDLSDKVRELLRVLALPAESVGRRQMLQKVIAALEESV